MKTEREPQAPPGDRVADEVGDGDSLRRRGGGGRRPCGRDCVGEVPHFEGHAHPTIDVELHRDAVKDPRWEREATGGIEVGGREGVEGVGEARFERGACLTKLPPRRRPRRTLMSRSSRQGLPRLAVDAAAILGF